MNAGQDGEPSREAVVEELRAWGLLALDRLDPLIGRMSAALSAPADATGAHPCTACPVCAALADVRAGRADALAEAARHATGLLAALRVVLATDGAETAAAPSARSERVVQRITVERTPTC